MGLYNHGGNGKTGFWGAGDTRVERCFKLVGERDRDSIVGNRFIRSAKKKRTLLLESGNDFREFRLVLSIGCLYN